MPALVATALLADADVTAEEVVGADAPPPQAASKPIHTVPAAPQTTESACRRLNTAFGSRCRPVDNLL